MFKRVIIGGLATVLLTGCVKLRGEEGLFRDRANDYKKSHLRKPLVTPKGVPTIKKEEIYKIPEIPATPLEVDEKPPTL